MRIAFVKLMPKPEYRAEFLRLLTEEVTTALKNEPGIIRFDILESTTNPGTYYAYEVYRDDAAHQHHRQQQYTKDFVAKTKGWYDVAHADNGAVTYKNVFPLDASMTPQQR